MSSIFFAHVQADCSGAVCLSFRRLPRPKGMGGGVSSTLAPAKQGRKGRRQPGSQAARNSGLSYVKWFGAPGRTVSVLQCCGALLLGSAREYRRTGRPKGRRRRDCRQIEPTQPRRGTAGRLIFRPPSFDLPSLIKTPFFATSAQAATLSPLCPLFCLFPVELPHRESARRGTVGQKRV